MIGSKTAVFGPSGIDINSILLIPHHDRLRLHHRPNHFYDWAWRMSRFYDSHFRVPDRSLPPPPFTEIGIRQVDLYCRICRDYHYSQQRNSLLVAVVSRSTSTLCYRILQPSPPPSPRTESLLRPRTRCRRWLVNQLMLPQLHPAEVLAYQLDPSIASHDGPLLPENPVHRFGLSTYSSTSITSGGRHTFPSPLWSCLFPPIPACTIMPVHLYAALDGEAPLPHANLLSPSARRATSFPSSGTCSRTLKRKHRQIARGRRASRIHPHQIITLRRTLAAPVQLDVGVFKTVLPGFFIGGQQVIPYSQLSALRPATPLVATLTATCARSINSWGSAASTPAAQITNDITLPQGASNIDVFLPVADTPGSS